MLSGFLKLSGLFILKLIYGEKNEEKISEKFELSLLLSALNICWLISIISLFSSLDLKSLIMIIGYPTLIALWAAYERKKNKKS